VKGKTEGKKKPRKSVSDIQLGPRRKTKTKTKLSAAGTTEKKGAGRRASDMKSRLFRVVHRLWEVEMAAWGTGGGKRGDLSEGGKGDSPRRWETMQ